MNFQNFRIVNVIWRNLDNKVHNNLTIIIYIKQAWVRLMDYDAYIKSDAWKKIVNQRLQIDKHTCQMCGTHGSPNNPLECHHFGYKTLGNEDVWTDVVIVCDCCHQLISRLMNRITSPDGRRGWTNKYIPKATVITYNGLLQEHRKENLENARKPQENQQEQRY